MSSYFYLPVKVFATQGSDILAQDICEILERCLPVEHRPKDGKIFGEMTISRFSNQNLQAQIESVRGCFVVVVHTQVPPVNENLIMLFALLDAIKNANPADVLLIFPYMPYTRSDSKNKPRISTMGEFLPDVINRVLEIKRVLLLDPHDTHIKHYFHPTADEITALYLLANFVGKGILAEENKDNWMVIFPDAGAYKRYQDFPVLLSVNFAHIDKVRPRDDEKPEIKGIIGPSLQGKNCILIDDEVATGGTTFGDAKYLIEQEGAKKIIVTAIHGVMMDQKLKSSNLKELSDFLLAEDALAREIPPFSWEKTDNIWEIQKEIERLINVIFMLKMENSCADHIIVTDSIPVKNKILNPAQTKITVLSVAGLLAEAVQRIVQNQSITDLHNPACVDIYSSL